MKEGQISVHARIAGEVQGVWYRAWTQREAAKRGLTGWVRNEPDGAVTALICGPETAVKEMLDLLWEGPPAARVADVSVEPAQPDGGLSGFEVLR